MKSVPPIDHPNQASSSHSSPLGPEHVRCRSCLAGFFAAVAGICFGTVSVLMVKAYEDNATPIAYVIIRGFVAGIVLVLAFLFRGYATAQSLPQAVQASSVRKSRGGKNGQPIKLMALMALSAAWYAGFSLSLFSAFERLPVSVVSLIFYTYPLVVLALSLVRHGAKDGMFTVAMHGVAFLGLVLAICPAVTSESTENMNVGGILLACSSSVCFAGVALTNDHLAKFSTPPLLAGAVTNLGLAGILAAAFGLAASTGSKSFLPWGVPQIDTEGAVFFALAVLLYIVSQLSLFFAFASASRAEQVTFFLNAEPLVSVALAVAFLDETLTWYQWIGIAVLLTALSLSTVRFPCAPTKQILETSDLQYADVAAETDDTNGNDSHAAAATLDTTGVLGAGTECAKVKSAIEDSCQIPEMVSI